MVERAREVAQTGRGGRATRGDLRLLRDRRHEVGGRTRGFRANNVTRLTAGILVPMDMEKTDAQSEFQAIRNLEVSAAANSVHHMNAPLTHDIVANEGRLYTPLFPLPPPSPVG